MSCITRRGNIINFKLYVNKPSAYMVRLYVNVQFKVKPLGTCTSSSRTKNILKKNVPIEPPNVCTKFQVSSTSIS